MHSLLTHRDAGTRARGAVHLTLGFAIACVASAIATTRVVTAQPPQTPPDRITLRSPNGRSEVVIAVTDSGVMRITLSPRGETWRAGRQRPASLRLIGGRHPTLELLDDREQIVGSLGGPVFRRTER